MLFDKYIEQILDPTRHYFIKESVKKICNKSMWEYHLTFNADFPYIYIHPYNPSYINKGVSSIIIPELLQLSKQLNIISESGNFSLLIDHIENELLKLYLKNFKNPHKNQKIFLLNTYGLTEMLIYYREYLHFNEQPENQSYAAISDFRKELLLKNKPELPFNISYLHSDWPMNVDYETIEHSSFQINTELNLTNHDSTQNKDLFGKIRNHFLFTLEIHPRYNEYILTSEDFENLVNSVFQFYHSDCKLPKSIKPIDRVNITIGDLVQSFKDLHRELFPNRKYQDIYPLIQLLFNEFRHKNISSIAASKVSKYYNDLLRKSTKK